MVGCGPRARDGQNNADSHRRMLDLLQQIKYQAAGDNEYFEDASVRSAEEELALLSSYGAGADGERFALHWVLGNDLVRLGENEKGIEHLLAAYNLLPRVRNRLTSDEHQQLLQDVGVAYLRLGETENCIHCRTGESCILPIRAGGIHVKQTGSRKAIAYFELLLDEYPDHLTSRWLLNIAYMTVGEYPARVPSQFLIPPSAFESQEEFPRFIDVAEGLGLKTLNCSGGVVVDDFDDDGFLDILTSTWDPRGQMRYFRNNGDGTFTDQTKEAGLTGLLGGLNMVQGDYDNDGHIDVLVLRGAWLGDAGKLPNSLLRNDGTGKFRDVTFDAGLGEEHYPTQTAAWADYDNDGDLDLYIGNERTVSQLFRNNGDGTFTDVAKQAGVENNDFAKGVVWGDFDNDRFPDLYVSNIERDNRLYRNNGDGTFTDIAPQLGVTRPRKSFPVWFWDFNNDGALDLYVPSYETGVQHVAADYLGLPHDDEADRSYAGDGKGGFREVAAEMGLTRVTQPMGANFGDLDNDGFLDFYLGTGYVEYQALMPNLMFHNRSGERFSDVTFAGGFGHLQKGHGVSFADLDNDGDQDVFIQMGGANPGDAFGNVLFENPGFGKHWIKIKLVGHKSNRVAIGARIRADIDEGGTKRSIYKWVNSGGSFGANPLRQELGLGDAAKIDLLEIHWPTTNQTQQFRDVPADQFIEIHEGQSEYRHRPCPALRFRPS